MLNKSINEIDQEIEKNQEEIKTSFRKSPITSHQKIPHSPQFYDQDNYKVLSDIENNSPRVHTDFPSGRPMDDVTLEFRKRM